MKVAPVTRTRNDQTAGYIVNIVFFCAKCWLLPKQTKSLRKFPVTFQRKTHISLDLSKWAQKPHKKCDFDTDLVKYRQISARISAASQNLHRNIGKKRHNPRPLSRGVRYNPSSPSTRDCAIIDRSILKYSLLLLLC